MKQWMIFLLVLVLAVSFLSGITAAADTEGPAYISEETDNPEIMSETEEIRDPEITSETEEIRDPEITSETEAAIDPETATETEEGKQTESNTIEHETDNNTAGEVILAEVGSGVDASAHFHATITTNRDTYTSDETAQVSIRYTIDQDTISPGDYVVITIPADIAASASFSYSRQHFTSAEDLGNGQYKLIFGDNAATGLSGSMTIRAKMNADEVTADKITAGDGEKEITVIPAGTGETGTGDYKNEAIMKDGLGNDDMSYGGYDYSQDNGAQIGLFDSSVDHDFIYRLFINRKNVSMTDVKVNDMLPDGMYYVGTDTVRCYKIDASSMTRTDETVNASVSISGQSLSVNLGDINYPVEIEYTVHVPAQTSVYLRNHSEVIYNQDGTTYKEHCDYIAQGNDYSAANGVKSVDKTIISEDPADQWVTYTIRFWNENSFAAGEIRLIDDLDDHVRYLYSDNNEYFELTVDENDPSILYITNVKDIPASTEVYETFVCDFSGVPVGYTVFNTTGGNTTRTTKISGSVSFSAKKTVDNQPPEEDGKFSFRLMDENHHILQTAVNNSDGIISFKEIKYGKEDLGRTYIYYIAEVIPAGDDSYIFDNSEYKVTVTVKDAVDEEGVMPVSVTITKEDVVVTEIVFNNIKQKVEETSSSESDTEEKPDESQSEDVTSHQTEKQSESKNINKQKIEDHLPDKHQPKKKADAKQPSSANPDTADDIGIILWIAVFSAAIFGVIFTIAFAYRNHSGKG